MTKKLLALLGVGALTITLAACSSAEPETRLERGEKQEMPYAEPGLPEDPATSEPAEPAPEPSDPAPSGTSDPGGQSAPSGELTPPGTELSFGETATIDFTVGTQGQGLVEITPLSITKGSPQDTEELGDVDEDAKGNTPYFIEVEITGVDEASTSLEYYNVDSNLEGLFDNGERADRVYTSSWSKCPIEYFPSGFGPGVTFTTCIPVYSAGDEHEVTGLHYTRWDTDYDSKPVVWTDK
ncbi:hypothetical protein [Gulosibacter sp. 10]|uniref:hypothetical protein n=1 Tax=Gulosibacter sp. 10 TaxID=1255570 RepID=UPI00097F21DF|nr:hypothetical protein [Gulosibacter sp. 10]SJM59351.1 hypothetical protein FM112_06425 [Gulosibacter sp. 10]